MNSYLVYSLFFQTYYSVFIIFLLFIKIDLFFILVPLHFLIIFWLFAFYSPIIMIKEHNSLFIKPHPDPHKLAELFLIKPRRYRLSGNYDVALYTVTL